MKKIDFSKMFSFAQIDIYNKNEELNIKSCIRDSHLKNISVMKSDI